MGMDAAASAQDAGEETLKELGAKASRAKAIAAQNSQEAMDAQKQAKLAADVATEQTDEANRLAAAAAKLTEKAQAIAAKMHEKASQAQAEKEDTKKALITQKAAARSAAELKAGES